MTSPLVSCLCVTEGRSAFLPWLLWSFDRQTWPNKELVIVDGSEQPFSTDRADIRVVAVAPGTGIAAKRNRALGEVRGDYLAWFDDDDWQHPERLEQLCGLLHGGAAEIAGCTSGWFVDLWKGRCAPYHPTGDLIFNSCVFSSDLARSVAFDERLRRASDTPWIGSLRRRAAGKIATIDRRTYTFWLCHDDNVSNPRSQRRCVLPLKLLEDALGEGAWDRTGAELEQLRTRLARSTAA